MQAVFPGRPQAALQAFSVVSWDDSHLVAYISRNALIILRGPRQLLQTIFHEDDENDQLQAVSINESSRRIAVCTSKVVYLYNPIELEDGIQRWTLQHRLVPESNDSALRSLAWGYSDEILAAGDHLTLLRPNPPLELWSRKLANPAKIAAFAHDATLIATTGNYDRLVKVWRRLFVGGDTERFDSTYLSHPAVVTGLNWRGKPSTEEHVEYVLYTTCADGKLRVWTATDHHGLQALQLWVELDLFVAIPSTSTLRSGHQERRFFVVIDSWTFASLVNGDTRKNSEEVDEEKPAVTGPYQEITEREPELCLILDERGNMSSWGLERVGCKAREETHIFNINQVGGLDLDFSKGSNPAESYSVMHAFASRDGSKNINLLVQHFDGRIQWYAFKVDAALTTVEPGTAMTLLGNWTGHSSPIDRLTVLDKGMTLKSESVEETMLWKFKGGNTDMPLEVSPEPLVNGHSSALQSKSEEATLANHLAGSGLVPSKISISDGMKAAIVDEDKISLSIWDMKNEHLEHRISFQRHEEINCVEWTATGAGNSVLAIALPHKVLLYMETLYDFAHRRDCWLQTGEIDISLLTNIPVADVAWLSHGTLVLAAGLQMFQYRPTVSPSILIDAGLEFTPETDTNILQATGALHQALPIYHPGVLNQISATGRFDIVDSILHELYAKLKFFTEGDEFDSVLGLDLCRLFSSHSSSAVNEESIFTSEKADNLAARLNPINAPYLTPQKQKDLELFVTAFGVVEKQRLSVDKGGIRYLLAFQRQTIETSIGNKASRKAMHWREICWASRCTSQDILVDLVSKAHQGRLLWKDARDSGLFMWLSDSEALRAHFETIARNEYTKTDEKNPVDCTLYYLALKKKQVLVGLWRMAGWNREQVATLRLLANDFADPKWKTTALKNAYALLGKRRFEYAAAFFLLADQLKDACSVLANQVGDLQLAITVARVYEGDDGAVLKELLQDTVLPQAAGEGDRWLASWAYLLLNRRDLAAGATYKPLKQLISSSETLDLSLPSYLKQDPSLPYWLAHLRDEIVPTYNGPKPSPTSNDEWNLLLRSSRLYSRMGCDVLSLDLLQNWSFAASEPTLQPESTTVEPNDLIRDDGIEEAAADEGASLDQAAAEKVLTVDGKPRVKVEAEPSTASILDAFDF